MAAPLHRVLPPLSVGYLLMTGLFAPSATAQIDPVPPTVIPLQANPIQTTPAAEKLLPIETAAKDSEQLEVLPPPDLQETPNASEDEGES
jgi:hypothetical protein